MSSSTRGLFLGLGVLSCVLLTSGARAYRNTRRMAEDAAWVAHTHQVLETLQGTLEAAVEAETSQRGYLLTRDLGYLQPYQAAAARVEDSLQRLKQLVADNPGQEGRIPDIQVQAAAKLKELKQTIDLENQDPGAGRRLVQAHLTSSLMDSVRSRIEAMTREERSLLAEREQTFREGYRTAILSGAVFALAGLALAAGLLLQLRRHLRYRARHERELDRERETLRHSEARFRAAFERSDVAMALTALDGSLFRVNQAFAAMLGTTVPGLQARSVWDITHPEDLALSREGILGVAQGGSSSFRAEKRYLRPDGGVVWGDLSTAAVLDEAGRPQYLVAHIQDITERKRAEAELREAIRRKDEFLATLAHELRNPLAPIRTGAYLLGLRDSPDPETRRIQELIGRQAAHMARLVDDLLDVARIEQGKVELRRQRLDLGQVMVQALEACGPALEACGHRVALALPDPALELEADPVRLEQMLCNLLNNAGKCTPDGGTIRLSAAREGAEAVLRLGDNGIGMTPEVLAHAFDLFYQAGPAMDRPSGGLGIGLTLVQRLAQLHGGSITASSEGPGRGSEFVLRLPALAVAASPPEPPPAAARRGGRKHVLIVDDDRNVRTTSEMLLTAMDYQVSMAATGEKGVEQARTLRPDIALIDLGMPGLNGLEVAARIRAELGSSIYLVALTGYSRDSDIAETRAAGFDRHLVKSGDPCELLSLLQEVP